MEAAAAVEAINEKFEPQSVTEPSGKTVANH
jgi:hypothetical protein